MDDSNIIILSFSVEELKLIAHSLYQTNNKLGYTANIDIYIKNLSSLIQRKINGLIK